MGRLIRKKTASKKKIKTDSQDMSSSEKSGEPAKVQVAKSTASSGDSMVKKIIPIIRKNSVGTKVVAGKQKKTIVDKSIQFLREVKIELKKVTWPSRKQRGRSARQRGLLETVGKLDQPPLAAGQGSRGGRIYPAA